MSDDLIRRQSAIDALTDMNIKRNFDSVYDGEMNRTRRAAQRVIAGLPSAQTEPQWIPCSERLPKYGENVLITNDKGNVSYGRFRGVEFWQEDGDAHWHWKHNTTEHVLAWMPLPEPYTMDGDVKNDEELIKSLREYIQKAPLTLLRDSSDSVEVVRCKDCKHLGENDGYYFCNAIGIAFFGDKPNWYCADAERKE